jgi:hypothetical protein
VCGSWDSAEPSELYSKMSEIRSAIATADMKERLEAAHKAKERHDEAAKALNAFSAQGDQKPLSTLLRSYNFVGNSTSSGTSRTLMLIDVTFSMDTLIAKAKSCIGLFFDRVQKVLEHEGIESGFELQIAAFSNYNVKVEEILENSTWEAKPHNLKQFLSHLDTRGGMGNEAVEVGLMHALSEHQKRPLDQIIIIGDAAANTAQDIENKRTRVPLGEGNQYWDKQKPMWSPSGIPKMEATGVLRAIQAVQPIPVHCYHMAERAATSFQQLANMTPGGTSQALDINSSSGAQLLTDAVCKQILSSLGGKVLADAYERIKPSFNR